MKILKFLRIVNDAINIDVYDMNYVYSNPTILKRFFTADPIGLPRKGLFVRIIAFFYQMLSNFNPYFWVTEGKIDNGSIIFYAQSLNQKKSLELLTNKIDNASMFGPCSDYPLTITTFFAYLYSLPFLPLIFYFFFRSEGLIKQGFHYNFNKYWLTYGFYISMRLWLHRVLPKAIVFSNDHNMENRVLAKASKDEGISTVYLQHASVSSFLPQLSFDYALLDGRDALHVYNDIGFSRTKVFLIGISKFDDYYETINYSNRIDSIGVCSNWLEPFDRVEELCVFLRENFPKHEIYLRPHPGDKRINRMIQLAEDVGINYSNSKKEGVFDFLQQVDLIFAGNSNIHLEAALVNVYPIYYDFTLNPEMETYSFLRTDLCEYSSNPNEAYQKIVPLVDNRPNIRNKAKIYCNTVDTIYDGHSTELASQLINQIAYRKNIKKEDWIKIDSVQLEAYEPSLSGNLLI